MQGQRKSVFAKQAPRFAKDPATGLIIVHPCYMYKRSRGALGSWQKRWFTLSAAYLVYRQSEAHEGGHAQAQAQAQATSIDLRCIASVAISASDPKELQLTYKPDEVDGAVEEMFRFRDKSESSAQRWLVALNQRSDPEKMAQAKAAAQDAAQSSSASAPRARVASAWEEDAAAVPPATADAQQKRTPPAHSPPPSRGAPPPPSGSLPPPGTNASAAPPPRQRRGPGDMVGASSAPPPLARRFASAPPATGPPGMVASAESAPLAPRQRQNSGAAPPAANEPELRRWDSPPLALKICGHTGWLGDAMGIYKLSAQHCRAEEGGEVYAYTMLSGDDHHMYLYRANSGQWNISDEEAMLTRKVRTKSSFPFFLSQGLLSSSHSLRFTHTQQDCGVAKSTIKTSGSPLNLKWRTQHGIDPDFCVLPHHRGQEIFF